MKTILYGIIVILSLSSCSLLREDTITTITGKPINVSTSCDKWDNSIIMVVLEIGEQKYVLAHSYIGALPRKIAEATALIQSEIAKGNEGKVELLGSYSGDSEFVMQRLSVSGNFPVDFR